MDEAENSVISARSDMTDAVCVSPFLNDSVGGGLDQAQLASGDDSPVLTVGGQAVLQ